MGTTNEKSWKSILLISIIVPLGLISTLKLAGVFQQSVVAQTINVDAASLNMTRPTDVAHFAFFIINKTVTNSFSQDPITANSSIIVRSYYKNEPFLGNCSLAQLTTQVETKAGFVQSVEVNFSRIDDKASLVIDTTSVFTFASGLNIDTVRDSSSTNTPYVLCSSLGNSSSCSLTVEFFWKMLDANDTDHNLTVTIGTLCFNGTDYLQINIPLQLHMVIH